MSRKTIIVAFDESNGIGKDNDIPWKLSEDMQHFKETTLNNVCIMGRKTWESIPDRYKPLPNRVNIVVSSLYITSGEFFNSFKEDESSPSFCAISLPMAISLAELYYSDKEIFIVGGGQLYKEALPLVDRLIVSKVKGHHECDVHFPDISDWNEEELKSYHNFTISEFTKDNA